MRDDSVMQKRCQDLRLGVSQDLYQSHMYACVHDGGNVAAKYSIYGHGLTKVASQPPSKKEFLTDQRRCYGYWGQDETDYIDIHQHLSDRALQQQRRRVHRLHRSTPDDRPQCLWPLRVSSKSRSKNILHRRALSTRHPTTISDRRCSSSVFASAALCDRAPLVPSRHHHQEDLVLNCLYLRAWCLWRRQWLG